MKKVLTAILIVMALSAGVYLYIDQTSEDVVGAALRQFKSSQIGGSPQAGYVLVTDGISSTWEAGGGAVDVVSNVVTNRILGRITAGTGDSEQLTDSEVRTLINVEDDSDKTDTANVTSAGAFMDSEATDLAALKAIDQSLVSGASPVFSTTNMTDATNKRFVTDSQEAKVDYISVTQAVDLDSMEVDIAALANGMVYKGDWDASAGTFPGAAAAQIGWFYYVSVAGTVDSVAFAVGDNIIAVTDDASTSTYASNWSKHDQTDAVQAVVGLTGSVAKGSLLAALNVEDGADVTDATNVTAAGAAMLANANTFTNTGDTSFAGNVGIGTTTPTNSLYVNDSSTQTATFASDHAAQAAVQILNNDSGATSVSKLGLSGIGTDNVTSGAANLVGGKEQQWTSTASTRDGYLALQVRENNSMTEKVRIDSAGNVGIGTTGPATKIHTYSDDTSTNQLTLEQDGTGDSSMVYELTGAKAWQTGIDNSDSDKFKIGSSQSSTWANTRLTIDGTSGNVGIGTATPTNKLTISGAFVAGGILVSDSSITSSSPVIEVQGRRDGANNSQTFTGGLALAGLRTDAAVDNNKSLGTVYFGGNHTDETESNLLYTASISATAEGTFSNSTTMPTGLSFYTGSEGLALGTPNDTYGEERMRIDASGNVGIGTTSPSQALSVQGNVLADSYLEYSPKYVGDALSQILDIKEEPNTKEGDWAEVDHSTLPSGVRYEEVVKIVDEVPVTFVGRDLGKSVQFNLTAIQQLYELTLQQQAEIEALKLRIDKLDGLGTAPVEVDSDGNLLSAPLWAGFGVLFTVSLSAWIIRSRRKVFETKL